VAWITEELGIHLATLYNWRKAWRLQGEVVPSSEKEPEGWSAITPFAVFLAVGTWFGDFQERCHSWAAIQAACINVNSRASSFSFGGLFIHTSAG
jgi:hypothetical protein